TPAAEAPRLLSAPCPPVSSVSVDLPSAPVPRLPSARRRPPAGLPALPPARRLPPRPPPPPLPLSKKAGTACARAVGMLWAMGGTFALARRGRRRRAARGRARCSQGIPGRIPNGSVFHELSTSSAHPTTPTTPTSMNGVGDDGFW